ncbi:MAG: hypothetical protein ACRDM2_09235 [Gaiellaceae bacterium]
MTDSPVVRQTILVAVGAPEEAHDLARLLARHGLSSQVSGGDVELRPGRERIDSVLADLTVALGRWLEDTGRQSISLTAGGRWLRYDVSGRYAVERRHSVAP